MGEILLWVFRYAAVALFTYLWVAYIDLVKGPSVEFRRNLVPAALWPLYWLGLAWRTFRGER